MSAVRVPLLLRPPNPPLPFVGRAVEEKRLVHVIERSAVAVVCGFSGVGKSGLVAHALAGHFADARERTFTVDAKENPDVVDGAARALAAIGASVTGTAHALVEALEDNALWLLVDNVERADALLHELLALAQKFCRRARIICVCREDPRAASLAPHTVVVGPMPLVELRALLEEIEPDLSESEAAGIAALAKGSPWRLRQLSMGGAVDEQGPEKSLLMLAPVAMGLLRTLSLVPASVAVDVLGRATRMPAPDALEALARRGYVEISGRGVRLHESARPLVDALFDADDRNQRALKLVRAAVDVGTLDIVATVLPLLAASVSGAPDMVAALLDKHARSLRRDGHARALLDVVDAACAGDPKSRAALAPHALTLALDVGGDALAHAEVGPDDAVPAVRALAAVVLAARGDSAGAVAAASSVASDKAAAPRDRLRALEVLFRLRADAGGDADDNNGAMLARLTVPADAAHAADAVFHAALTLSFGSSRGRASLALDARGLVRAFDALAVDDKIEIAAVVARALRSAGDPRSAVHVAAQAPETRAHAAGRAVALEHAHAALAVAALVDARDRFVAASSAGPPAEQVEARLGALAARLAIGELRGFDDDVATVVALTQEREVPHDVARTAHELADALGSLRGNERGRALPSLDEARKARARLRDAGRALDALEASSACIDAAIVARDTAAIAVEAEQLAAAAAHARSRRYALDARFAALAVDRAGDGRVPATALVELTRATDENPRVARRAAALLGEAVPLDDVDRAVLAVLSNPGAPAASVVKQTAGGPEWTVDASTMRIILADGRVVDLSTRKVLFDLLATLCQNGGAATKELLLERAWGVRDYHPLRHDNRLKVAVRKLRRLLEEILGDDPIESAADGYRLRGKVRFLAG